MPATRLSPRLVPVLGLVIGLIGLRSDGVLADDAPPIGRYITLESPVEGRVAGLVRNTALELQNQAVRDDRPAYLVLEVTPGTSEFAHAISLAKFLVSPEIARVRTVAWVPENVTGNNAILALACREIVMHPDAELGDIGRGKSLDEIDEQLVLKLVGNRHNPKVAPALARGMTDPSLRILRAEVTEGETVTVHVVTEDEFAELEKSTDGTIRSRVLSEPGDPLVRTGRKWRDLDILAVATAEDRTELLELYDLPFDVLHEETPRDDPAKVAMIRIDDRIDPVMGAFIRRQIDRSLARGVTTILFEIDTAGGVLTDSADLANTIADLGDRKKPIRTIAYVPVGDHNGAFGGAAIVALGCDEIFLQEDAEIGDVAEALVRAADGEEDLAVLAKPLEEILAELADRKNRPRALLRAMVAEGTEVYRVRHADDGRVSFMSKEEIALSAGEWVEDGANPLVPESIEPNPLRVNGQRAAELQIAAPPVADLDDLRLRLGIPDDQRILAAERNWVDDVVFALNTDVALYVLLVGGFVLMFLEAHMTTGIMGFGSILCFVLFFWSRYLGGTAGWLEVILFVGGLVCLVIEGFVLPGFGVFGVTGALMVFGSIVMASQTFYNLEPNEDFRRLATTMGTMGASLVTVIVVGAFASRYLPHLPLFRHMILQPPGADQEEQPQLKRELTEGFAGIHTGDEGTASTTLRPAGKATIKGVYLDVVSDGPYIDPGQPIRVVSVTGNRVVVREVG